MDSSSFSGTSKRAKAPGNVTQVAHCLVDGCNADLSLCRDYHRRHKVCETHSKTPKVTIGGREQRFCQQCSRFHSLVEFDEGKRSCRKRLDGHNRRRRKPQPDSITRNSGLVFSTPPGVTCTRLLSFSSPQIMSSTTMSSSSWVGAVKPESNIGLYNNHRQLNYNERQNSFPECSSYNYKGVHQIQFMQGNDNPFLDPNAATRNNDGSQNILSNGLTQVVDSDRALSLLSSAPPLPQPQSFHNLHYGGIGQYPFTQESKAVIPTTDSQGNDSSLQYPETLHHVQEGSSTTGSHQTLTFMWE